MFPRYRHTEQIGQGCGGRSSGKVAPRPSTRRVGEVGGFRAVRKDAAAIRQRTPTREKSWLPLVDPTICRAEFVGANLRGARFVESDLSGAAMRGVPVENLDIDAPWLIDG